MKIGDKKNIFCTDDECKGILRGVYGGFVFVGETRVKYTQLMDCKCDRCGKELSEVFEVWDESNEEFWVSENICVPISEHEDICFEGLGMPAAEISSEFSYFLKYGKKR